MEHEYGDTLNARLYSDSSLYYAERSQNHYLLAIANQYKGWYYQDRSNYPEAKKHFLEALRYSKLSNLSQCIADSYGNLGIICLEMNEHVRSLDYQLKSVRQNDVILESIIPNDERQRALEGKTYALSNIADIFRDLDLFDKALEYERRSLNGELRQEIKVERRFHTLQ
jgi:tetratricopeptide (TPR) repeat protein